jgi:hypothetical protein
LIRLIDESRRRDAFVESLGDAPPPAAAPERPEPRRGSSMLIDLQGLGDPDAAAIALDPGLPKLASGSEVEDMTATLMYAPVTKNAMLPPAAPAPAIATAAPQLPTRVARVRALLCLGLFVFLCLGVVVLVGLDACGVTDASASSYVSLGL